MTPISSSLFRKTLAIILAGGQGERLYPLTKDRSKPAVPFGGKYRIIDFALSNAINSGFRKIYLITQYKSQSLDTHIREGWSFLNGELGEYIYCIPPQFRTANHWYQGTADAVFQNLHVLQDDKPEYVIILSGDHIYKMDYLKMLQYHIAKQADLTIAGIEFQRDQAHQFGVMVVNEDNDIIEFQEKPKEPKPLPNKPDFCYVNMGIYIFSADAMAHVLVDDAKLKDSAHDFGKNVIPSMLGKYKVTTYNFEDENMAGQPYWRDIGTLDSYFDTSMDLISVSPTFNLYDIDWPIRTYQGQYPPAKNVFSEPQEGGRMGVALDSIVSGGVIISGGRVTRSLLSPNVRIHSYSSVDESILFNNVSVGRNSKIKRAIIDKNVVIPENSEIGYNLEEDKKRFFVTPSGIVVISKNQRI
ncbi:MAG TPA: glucose-1-phosphate adenylyltransferase [bacterium]|nr:glucose-1-phosphate adenylyltransferase [bacterium]